MNKKGQIIEIAGAILIILLFAGLLTYGCLWVSKIGNDAEQEANCDTMAKNGYNTHIEIIHMLGIPYKDCYIQTSTGAVPYDRFRAIE
jgi:hypothetical protein